MRLFYFKLLCVLLMLFFLYLGAWQWQKGWHKSHGSPVPLCSAQSTYACQKTIRGTWQPTLLITDMLWQGKPAYHVWQTIHTEQETDLWIRLGISPHHPLDASIRQEGLVTLTVTLSQSYVPWGVRLIRHRVHPEFIYASHLNAACDPPSRRPLPYGAPLHPIAGLISAPMHSALPAERHYGYAYQWWGCALVCLWGWWRFSQKR